MVNEYVWLTDEMGRTLRSELYNNPPSAASYIIFKKGDKTYAKKCRTGQIEFSGLDAATVIQSAIDSLSDSESNVIVLKGDFFSISRSINVNKIVRITGATKQYPILYANFNDAPIFNVTSDYVVIENLALYGQKSTYNAGGIKVNAVHAIIRNVLLNDFKLYALLPYKSYNRFQNLFIYNCDNVFGKVTETYSTFNVFEDCRFATNAAIPIEASSTENYIRNWIFKDCSFEVNTNPVTVKDYVYGICFVRCWFEETSASYNFNTDRTVQAGHITFSSCFFHGRGINVANVDFLTLDTPHFYNIPASYYPVTISNVNHYQLIGSPYTFNVANPVLLSVNSGTATIPNGQTSVTFAHGLAGKPTLVVLGATHDEVADAVWSADATNITITIPAAVTADRDISWYAEYKP